MCEGLGAAPAERGKPPAGVRHRERRPGADLRAAPTEHHAGRRATRTRASVPPGALVLRPPRGGALFGGKIPAEARQTNLTGIADVKFPRDDLTVGFAAAPPF